MRTLPFLRAFDDSRVWVGFDTCIVEKAKEMAKEENMLFLLSRSAFRVRNG